MVGGRERGIKREGRMEKQMKEERSVMREMMNECNGGRRKRGEGRKGR